MTNSYFKSDLGNIFDVYERYTFVRDEIGYCLQFFAAVYDLSLSELEFIINSIHFDRGEIFKNLDSAGFFMGKDVSEEFLSLVDKGYFTIETKNLSDDNYYYSYSHTQKAKNLAKDLDKRLSSLLDDFGRGKDLVDFAYTDVIEKLNYLFDDLRILGDDKYLLGIKDNSDLDPEYTRRYELVRDLKKALNEKYPYLSIINFDEYKEPSFDDLDEDDENFEEDFDDMVENYLKDGRHLVEIEYTLNSRRLKTSLLVNVEDFSDVIEIGDLDDDDMGDGEAFTHFIGLLDDFNRDHKKIKENLRNLYSFIAPAYDLSLGEFEFCLYYSTIYTCDDDEIYDIDGYFINDSREIVANLIQKGYLYKDEDGFFLTEKSDAVFKNMGALFAATMEKNKVSYDDILTCSIDYRLGFTKLSDFTYDFTNNFSFEDFRIEDKISDEIDEYSLSVPFDKAVLPIVRKYFSNPKILAVKDEGSYISIIFTTDDQPGKEILGRIFKTALGDL